jgi:hypothetical protein
MGDGLMKQKLVYNWKEFNFTRNERPYKNEDALADIGLKLKTFKTDEENILDDIGDFVEQKLKEYPNKKYKYYDILEECILSLLRHYKKNNHMTKTNVDYLDFVLCELYDKGIKDIMRNYYTTLPESENHYSRELCLYFYDDFYNKDYEVKRK